MSQIRKVVEALMKHGPKYTTISRETGVPITTVRYILKEKLPKLGFTLHAAINYGKLGLQRYLVIMEPSLSPDHMVNLLDLFGETMYLNYYSYLLQNRKFLTIFSIPPEFETSFMTFLDELVRLRVLNKYYFKKLYYRRIIPFRIDCFDFDKGVWLQNWNNTPRKEEVSEIYEEPEQIEGLTSLDIRILAELQKDSFLRYTTLSRMLNKARQTIKRHYEKISKTIYLYVILWMPKEHPELYCTPILVRANPVDSLRKKLHNVPFIHLEMKTEDLDYYAVFFVPSIGFYKVLRYISESKCIELDYLSMDYASNFVPHYNLYDDRKGWVNIFEKGVEKIVKEVRLSV